MMREFQVRFRESLGLRCSCLLDHQGKKKEKQKNRNQEAGQDKEKRNKKVKIRQNNRITGNPKDFPFLRYNFIREKQKKPRVNQAPG